MPNFALPSTLPAVSRRRCGVPISLKSAGVLERDVLGHRQLRGGIHQLAIAELAAGGRVHDDTLFRVTGGRIDIPALAAAVTSMTRAVAPARRSGT